VTFSGDWTGGGGGLSDGEDGLRDERRWPEQSRAKIIIIWVKEKSRRMDGERTL
jgi:hypothetical protein